MGEIIVWIIGGVGLLLFLAALSVARINEREIKDSQKHLDTAKPWDITETWKKQKNAAEEANSGAAVLMFIGGFMMLFTVIYLLGKWGCLTEVPYI